MHTKDITSKEYYIHIGIIYLKLNTQYTYCIDYMYTYFI